MSIPLGLFLWRSLTDTDVGVESGSRGTVLCFVFCFCFCVSRGTVLRMSFLNWSCGSWDWLSNLTGLKDADDSSFSGKETTDSLRDDLAIYTKYHHWILLITHL